MIIPIIIYIVFTYCIYVLIKSIYNNNFNHILFYILSFFIFIFLSYLIKLHIYNKYFID